MMASCVTASWATQAIMRPMMLEASANTGGLQRSFRDADPQTKSGTRQLAVHPPHSRHPVHPREAVMREFKHDPTHDEIALRHLGRLRAISVSDIAYCPCGAPATTRIQVYLRCQPCANMLVNKWNEVRSNLDGEDS